MLVHVNFNDKEQCELFNNDSKIKNGEDQAQKFINENISDIIYNRETGQILLAIRGGELQYLQDFNGETLLNISAITYIELDKNNSIEL
jgi:hypothetical protein